MTLSVGDWKAWKGVDGGRVKGFPKRAAFGSFPSVADGMKPVKEDGEVGEFLLEGSEGEEWIWWPGEVSFETLDGWPIADWEL